MMSILGIIAVATLGGSRPSREVSLPAWDDRILRRRRPGDRRFPLHVKPALSLQRASPGARGPGLFAMPEIVDL